MTILDIVRIIRSNLKLLLASMIAGILLAAAYTLTRPVQYTASSSAQITAGNSQTASDAVLSQQLATGRAPYYSQLLSSPAVAQNVISASNGRLHGGDFSISGTSNPATSILGVNVVASSPEKAQLAANLAPDALEKQAQYVETRDAPSHTTVFHVFPLSASGLPSSPSSPKWPINLAFGGLLGLLCGLGVVVLRKQLDSRVRHTSELETITGTGVLGVIPRSKNLATETRGSLGSLGVTAESFRMLRTSLRYVSADQQPRSMVITSAVQSEGKSTVASNLARVLAAAGQQVVLVDTDLRRPVLHETFKADNTVGLTEVLTGQARLNDVIQPGDHKNLHLITAGRIPPNPSELVGSRRMSAVVESLSDKYFVILDAPPLLPVTDAGLLAVATDGAVVVYRHGQTHREQVALCTKILDQVGARNLGSILNMTPQKAMGSTIYGYGAGNYGATGYGYGYGDVNEDQSTAVAPTSKLDDLTVSAPAQQAAASQPTPAVPAHDSTLAGATAVSESSPSDSSTANDGPVSRRSIRRTRSE